MKKNLLKTLFAGLFLSMIAPLTASADVEINETNFPDENFRNYLWLYHGLHGTITDEQIEGITSIDVYSKNISSLQGIEYFTALTELSYIYGQLTSLDVSHNTALTRLQCQANQLTSLNVSGCMALEYISCNSNQLTSLDVSGCTALAVLWCDRNQLTSLNVSGCTALEDLYCNSNQLTSLDVSGCTALTHLSCGFNQLTSLNVSDCTALISLSCNDNQLKGIAMDAFVESLPINISSTEYKLYIYDDSGNDGNVCTRSQVAAIKEKGWAPYYCDYGYQQWLEYEGSDDETTDIKSSIRQGAQQGDAIYNLNGQRVGQPQRGLYIKNGKKVIVKTK